MSNSLTARLCLGTAQFGLEYGIANKDGKVSRKAAFDILDYASRQGVSTLDTAHSYGNSEALIGSFTAEYGTNFKIVSKAPAISNDTEMIARYCEVSLKRLKARRIYGYLAHKFSNIISGGKRIWTEFEFLKKKGLVKKIGVSLYKPEELGYLLDKEISFDIIEVPYNIFDQRFNDYFERLKKKDIEIYARSVFLQGLFFLKMDRIENGFSSAKDAMRRIAEISKAYDIPLYALCICFAWLNPYIDKIIIGVDSLRQLEEDISALKYADRVKEIYRMLESLKLHDEEVILPYNWKI